MSKHNYQRVFLVETAFAVLVVLASVIGCNKAREADAGKLRHQAETLPAPAMDAAYASVAEVRHFDVYNRYRTMFDDAADYLPPHAHEYGGGIRPALDVYDGVRPGTASAGCFLVTGPLDD